MALYENIKLAKGIKLADTAYKNIHVVGCYYPPSLLDVYVGNIYEEPPPIYVYIRLYYTFKSIYVPCIVENSAVLIKGRFTV
jgi:hypothetical protein